MCTMAALKNMKMTEVAIHCLSAMVQEIKKRSLQTSLLVRVIRYIPIIYCIMYTEVIDSNVK